MKSLPPPPATPGRESPDRPAAQAVHRRFQSQVCVVDLIRSPEVDVPVSGLEVSITSNQPTGWSFTAAPTAAS
jgi:hypothetical protein